jgi:hypothetical protein
MSIIQCFSWCRVNGTNVNRKDIKKFEDEEMMLRVRVTVNDCS